MPQNDYRKERTDYVVHETSWLFQRFNYFLIGIAFLVAALATIVSSQHFCLNGDGSYRYLVWFALSLCVVGYLLSFFFAIVNHLTSIMIKRLHDTLYDEPGTPLFKWTEKNLWPDGFPKGQHLFKGIHGLLWPSSGEEHQVAPHTYLVPLGFCFFWLALLLILLFTPNVEHRGLYWIAIGCLVAISIFVYCRVYFYLPCRQRRHNGNSQKSEVEAAR